MHGFVQCERQPARFSSVIDLLTVLGCPGGAITHEFSEAGAGTRPCGGKRAAHHYQGLGEEKLSRGRVEEFCDRTLTHGLWNFHASDSPGNPELEFVCHDGLRQFT